MDWSAWPSGTNSQCAVKNVDGQIGAQTVYLQKGKQFGYQEVTELIENGKVSFYLKQSSFRAKYKNTFLFKTNK